MDGVPAPPGSRPNLSASRTTPALPRSQIGLGVGRSLTTCCPSSAGRIIMGVDHVHPDPNSGGGAEVGRFRPNHLAPGTSLDSAMSLGLHHCTAISQGAVRPSSGEGLL